MKEKDYKGALETIANFLNFEYEYSEHSIGRFNSKFKTVEEVRAAKEAQGWVFQKYEESLYYGPNNGEGYHDMVTFFRVKKTPQNEAILKVKETLDLPLYDDIYLQELDD